MNPILTIEPLSGTFVTTETEPNFSPEQTTFKTETESSRNSLPVGWSLWKLDECFEWFIPILSVVYLIGAVGFGGLLLFYTLSR